MWWNVMQPLNDGGHLVMQSKVKWPSGMSIATPAAAWTGPLGRTDPGRQARSTGPHCPSHPTPRSSSSPAGADVCCLERWSDPWTATFKLETGECHWGVFRTLDNSSEAVRLEMAPGDSGRRLSTCNWNKDISHGFTGSEGVCGLVKLSKKDRCGEGAQTRGEKS